LTEAGGGAWTQLTVPMSMRETENEVNLLVPGAPSWSVRPDPTPRLHQLRPVITTGATTMNAIFAGQRETRPA
jgi:hypothetical protein